MTKQPTETKKVPMTTTPSGEGWTKGPLEAGSIESGTILRNGLVIYRLKPTAYDGGEGLGPADRARLEADTKLYAASPDLYAACKAARNMIAPVEDPSDEVGHRVLGLLDAALTLASQGAKAAGGGE